MYSLLFLSPLKNLNKLPPYVSEGVPWEEGQEEYSADRTQTLTSSNIAGMLWCSPYAHLALAGICWQHSSISPVRFFIFFCHMFSIWGAEARGGARRLVMVAAITAEAKHHHTAEGLCLHKPSNDKLTVRKQRLKMSIKFQYFLCTLTKSLSVEPQRSREEDRVYVPIGDWRYTSGTALGPLKPVFPLAPGQRLLTLFAFVLMPFAGDLSGNEKHASGEISLTESLHRF